MQHTINTEVQDNSEYTLGFNHAAILADFAPEILNDISQVNNEVSDYFDGFFAAKEYYKAEIEQTQNENTFQKIRNDSKDQINELER